MSDSRPARSGQRRATNVTLPEGLVSQAHELKINVSQACEAGLAAQVKGMKEKTWLAENRDAMDGWNARAAQRGLPLERFRSF